MYTRINEQDTVFNILGEIMPDDCQIHWERPYAYVCVCVCVCVYEGSLSPCSDTSAAYHLVKGMDSFQVTQRVEKK